MLKDLLESKKCILVAGSGGVGKTTLSASLALAAARLRPRVLVLTIDPARRLLQAFGYTDTLVQEGGEPVLLSPELAKSLGLPEGAQLSIAVLNPKWVVNQVVDQTLAQGKAEILRRTVLFQNMTQMIHGLTEYTAYEWVTRMLAENRYDLIILDTPPAVHAKDFFNAPEKIRNLMESRVFQLFLPGSGRWFKPVMTFGWIERILGRSLFAESRVFFETFLAVRDRVLERCRSLSVFFANPDVAVVAVCTPEKNSIRELDGLSAFLKEKEIPLQGVLMNQMDEIPAPIPRDWEKVLSEDLFQKVEALHRHQEARGERSLQSLVLMQKRFSGVAVVPIKMVYSEDGFEILRANADRLLEGQAAAQAQARG